jgi:hypothetical protein
LELRNANGNDKFELYAKCNEKCTEYFWFCHAKYTIYLTEGGEQRKIICTDEPIYAFHGNNTLLLDECIHLSKSYPISLIVEVKILRVEPKYVEKKCANPHDYFKNVCIEYGH